jgi:hypothetical protein
MALRRARRRHVQTLDHPHGLTPTSQNGASSDTNDHTAHNVHATTVSSTRPMTSTGNIIRIHQMTHHMRSSTLGRHHPNSSISTTFGHALRAPSARTDIAARRDNGCRLHHSQKPWKPTSASSKDQSPSLQGLPTTPYQRCGSPDHPNSSISTTFGHALRAPLARTDTAARQDNGRRPHHSQKSWKPTWASSKDQFLPSQGLPTTPYQRCGSPATLPLGVALGGYMQPIISISVCISFCSTRTCEQVSTQSAGTWLEPRRNFCATHLCRV